MKKLFIVLNVFAILAVLALATAILAHTPPKPEKVLKNTPANPDVLVSDLFPPSPSPLSASNLALIVDSDIFSPARVGGEGPRTAAKSSAGIKTARFDLAGICVMGGLKGAFIITSSGKKGKKQFYSIGSRIANTGYTLLEVSPEKESIVLGAGASRLTLTLDRDDSASKKRRKVKRKMISLQPGTTHSAQPPVTRKK
ncbi:MAG: hypothetical protein KAG97_09460, partial [Victivallales bacterium]|nr:hypothetical protein [Victivallales bacterium]